MGRLHSGFRGPREESHDPRPLLRTPAHGVPISAPSNAMFDRGMRIPPCKDETRVGSRNRIVSGTSSPSLASLRPDSHAAHEVHVNSWVPALTWQRFDLPTVWRTGYAERVRTGIVREPRPIVLSCLRPARSPYRECDRMSETLEPEKPEKIPSIPLAPLPRLWKTEPEDPEDPEETDQDRPLKKIAKTEADATAPKKASKGKLTFTKPKTDSKSAKPKSKSKSTVEGDAKDKKVLVEETPAFDTYQARQRARVILGSLLAFCILLGCWIFYRVLFHDPTDPSLYAEEPAVTQALPEARPSSLDGEALYMFNRAKEYAKQNRTDQAIGMLKRVVASYKGTTAAAEARVALERPKQGLPLFPEGPAVVALRGPIAAPPGATPPAVNPASPPASPGSAQGPLALAPNQPPAQPSPSSPAPQGPVSMLPSQPPTQTTPQARGPVAMLPTQPQGQSPQPAQAPVVPPRGPVSMVPTQPQNRSIQHDPIPSNPNQPPPPPGSGQVAMIVPAPAGGPSATPNPADAVDRKPAEIAALELARRPLPHGFAAKPEAGYHESGWPRMIVGERDGAPMVLVPGGTFTMGSDSGEPAEAPAHTVRLSNVLHRSIRSHDRPVPRFPGRDALPRPAARKVAHGREATRQSR